MKKRKIPLRMCVGCREMKPKKELVRIVRKAEGGLALDRTGKVPGRGAYVCSNPECLARARKIKALERVLECRVEPELYEALEKELGIIDG